MNNILITGASGQDGRVLLDLFPELFQDSRIIALTRGRHTKLHHDTAIILTSDYSFEHLLEVLNDYSVTHVLHLAGLSSVSHSIKNPVLAHNSIFELTKTVATACIHAKLNVRLVVANSSEIFGECPESGATLETPMQPLSPYASSKACVREYLLELSQKGTLDCGNLILFNHESKYRGDNFVLKKLLLSASNMKKNGLSRLEMGNLSMTRDWGDAYKYMHAAIYFLLSGKNEQILCSGYHASIHELATLIFKSYDLSFDEVYIQSHLYYRNLDIEFSFGAPSNIDNLQIDVSIAPEKLINKLIRDMS